MSGRNLLAEEAPSGGGRNLLGAEPTAAPQPEPRQPRAQAEPDFPTSPYAAYARTRVGRTADMPTVAEAAPGIPRGMIAGIPGFVGDIETLGRAGLRYAGADVDPRSTFPTTERVGQSLFGEPASQEERITREVGSFLSPMGAMSSLARGGRRLGRALVGETQAPKERIARAAEEAGFRLEPMQVRADAPRGSPGFSMANIRENQRLANELASSATGVRTSQITPKFLEERAREAGKAYDDIFLNRQFTLDAPIFAAVRDMADFERAVSPATVSGVKSAADNILDRFATATSPTQLRIAGDELKALRDRMSYIARSSEQGPVRHRAGNFVNQIDELIKRNDPKLAEKLDQTNQRYAAIKTLESMIEGNAIQGGNISLERLGEYVARNSYGYGSGTATNPLYPLGFMGRELKMRGRFEGAETPSDLLGALTSRVGRALNVAGRTQLARGVQRNISQGLRRPPVVGPAAVPAAAAGRSLEEEE